jgi:hypothetical protein
MGKKYPQFGSALSMPLSELPAMKALLARPLPARPETRRAKRVKKARQKT